MDVTINQPVLVKGERGIIKYYGETEFSSGKWIGVELDVPKGKNDGSVAGKRYFTCEKQSDSGLFGIFVRPNAIKLIEKHDNTVSDTANGYSNSIVTKNIPSMPPPSIINTPKSRSVSRASDADGQFSTVLSPIRRNHGKSDSISIRSVSSSIQNGLATPIPLKGENDVVLSQKIDQLKSKLTVMERKRKEDSEKIQHLQSEVQKVKRYENVAQRLQLKLKSTLDELHGLRLRIQTLEQENSQLNNENDEQALEMATLDKEMAEERCESLMTELKTARTKMEQLQLDFDILKEENELITSQSSTSLIDTATVVSLEKRNEKLENALIRLREISLNQESIQKDKISNLEKELIEYKSASKELSNITMKLNDAEIIISELHSRLDESLGAEDMIESLTEKNLELNERIDALQNTIDELETLKELHDELEDNQKIREEQLNKEIRSLESLNEQNQRQIHEIMGKNEYLEGSIVKYRELVEILDGDVERLRTGTGVAETDRFKDTSASDTDHAREAGRLDTKGGKDTNERRDTAHPRDAHRLNDTSQPPEITNPPHLRHATITSKTNLLDFELKKFDSQQANHRLQIIQCYLSEGYSQDEAGIESLLNIEKSAFLFNLYQSYFHGIISQNPSVITRICFILSDLEIDSGKIGDYLRHCSSKEFSNSQDIDKRIKSILSFLTDSIDSLRSENINETEFLAELENIKSTTQDIVSTRKSNQSSYCKQSFLSMKLFIDLILKLENSKNFWNSSFSLFQCKSMIEKHLEEFSRLSTEIKKPNCFSTDSIIMIKDCRIFIRSFAKLLIGLQQSDSPDQIISCSQKYLSESISNIQDFEDYTNQSITKLTKLQNIKLTEYLDLPTSPWISRNTALNQMKNQQKDLNEEINSLKQQMNKLTIESFNKDKNIDELQVNMDVLNARLSKSKGQLTDINKIKQELSSSLKKEKNLKNQLEDVKKMASEQEKALQQFRNSDIFGIGAKSLDSTMPLLALQGENASLKAALVYARKSGSTSNGYTLLKPAKPRMNIHVKKSISRNAHEFYKNLQFAAERFEVIQLNGFKKEWKPRNHMMKVRYLEQVKVMRELEGQLREVVSRSRHSG